MKIFSSKKRVAAIGVVTAATLVGGGAAFAYWTTTGSGSGSATVGSAAAWTADESGDLIAADSPALASGPIDRRRSDTSRPMRTR